MSQMEKYFHKFRQNIVGIDTSFQAPYGNKKIVYCDWIASGRLYAPIEKTLKDNFGPFVANTHTETNETGTRMTREEGPFTGQIPGGNINVLIILN